MTGIQAAVDVADWRRRVSALYELVRELSVEEPAAAHAAWVIERDVLFTTHASTPLLPADRALFAGLPVPPYDAAWRFELPIETAEHTELDVETGTDGIVPFERIGLVRVPEVGSLDVWRLRSYGGGLFVPVKDASAGRPEGTYGGGRYLLDTIKGADLGPGSRPDTIVLDFNFAYNPSCAYDPAWACPLAPAGNIVDVEIPVGERYRG
ncbi:DUF1684 domain-containing protein [Humibacter ginsenosidimutans]|uniref:DUF1684 domain-containing protein n=1 Tax=Humibacter ginsenosidimutans TaxID=2599293 RepID=A0A5B8M6J3_9MICO|nr:DUF1684 domain-containing protein [Humibacter ginsenosidimutans]QDZ16328.1 DUF1684 domain-containing protein [Humibacter ginsenosidimutans]